MTANLVTGRQLRAARAFAGLTQQDLAGELGVNERVRAYWS
jgi:transcriptional regulator with XRE-family HTH domain